MPNHREAPIHLRHDPKTGRKAPVTDDIIMSAVNSAGGLGKHDPETGLYKTFNLHCDSAEEAETYRLSLYRCALHMTKNHKAGQGLSMSVKKVKHIDGTVTLLASVYDKPTAKKYVDTKYGPNPEDKPYSPHKYRGHKNYG
jgi:hypothetical protein